MLMKIVYKLIQTKVCDDNNHVYAVFILGIVQH